MARFLHSIHSFLVRKFDKFSLALFWILGLGSGGLLFRYVCNDLVSLMPLAAKCQPSIIGLLCSFCLPFLFSAFAVYASVPKALYLICYLKALMIGYFSCGVFAAFGDSGWLVRCMLLFTDYFGTALLYSYCQRHISGLRGWSAFESAGYGCLFLIWAGMDYSYISPLLRHLLS